MVQTTLAYLAPMSERPAYDRNDAARRRNTKGDFREVEIQDARELAPPASLEREGFALAPHETAIADLYDEDAVRAGYYAEMEKLVAGVTGATRVVAFDHNVRSRPLAEKRERAAQYPVRYVHNDYTDRSGPQRVRDLMGDEADALLRHRFSVINVWKPITGPVQESPLAVCDATSLRAEDFVPTDLEYAHRKGEVYSFHFRPEHRWYYYPRMRADEAMLLKCYDSAQDGARYTAHTAFEDPTTPEGAPARESIEVRTLVFFSE